MFRRRRKMPKSAKKHKSRRRTRSSFIHGNFAQCWAKSSRSTPERKGEGAVCASHNANYNFSEAVETPTMLIKIDMQIACAREGEQGK
jgi:hypothetical protein